MVADRIESRSDQLKMDRRHFRAEDRVFLLHFLGKDRPLVIVRYDDPLFIQARAHTDRRQQGTDADTGCTEVVDLVDLETGVNLARPRQNI